MPKQHKEEFKKQAVAYYEQCHSLCMVAEKYQVSKIQNALLVRSEE